MGRTQLRAVHFLTIFQQESRKEDKGAQERDWPVQLNQEEIKQPKRQQS